MTDLIKLLIKSIKLICISLYPVLIIWQHATFQKLVQIYTILSNLYAILLAQESVLEHPRPHDDVWKPSNTAPAPSALTWTVTTLIG